MQRYDEVVPVGATARRLQWQHLPPELRATIEERIGCRVAGAASQGAGFTPGFASVLTCEDGSRHFVKAASVKAQRQFADSYREEIRKLRALGGVGSNLPLPQLAWDHQDELWVALSTQYVEGRNPVRPWRQPDLESCLDACERVADRLTPPPSALRLDSFAEEFAALPRLWDAHVAARPDQPERAEAAALAARLPEVTGGETLVHTDLRDDNVLLSAEGRVWICDWNWPVVGAPWIDSLLLLVGPRGDGLDVEQVIAGRRLLREVPAEHVDAMLAALVGYFWKAAGDPTPATSPYIRLHQAWQGEVCWAWLRERRGWA